MTSPSLVGDPVAKLDAPWIKVLGWCELVSGASGFIMLVLSAATYPRAYTRWDLTSAVAFLATSAIAGLLLLRQNRTGLRLSIWIQALQVVGFSAGLRFVAHAGPYITVVLATTGVGVWGGVGGDFIVRGAVDGLLNAIGLNFNVNFGFFADPLKSASATVGVNLVAIYFLVQLLRLKKVLPQPVGSDSPSRSHLAKLLWLGAAAIMLLLGGALFTPTRTLDLPDGRHFDLLQYDRNTLALYDPKSGTWDREQRLLIKYYSTYSTSDNMLAEARTIAPLFYSVADSMGVHIILLNPSRPLLARGFPLLVTTWNARFVRDSSGVWKEER